MSGIHIHPHDILDEGMPNIMPYLDELRDLAYLFPQVNTIFERNPVPTGVLPRNPQHPVVLGDGTLQAVVPSYVDSGIDQRRAPQISPECDPLMIVRDAMSATDIEVIPWFNILNGDFLGERLEDNQVIDHSGRPVEHWLCPNGPDVVDYWTRVFSDIHERYGFTQYMIDRIRFPDWAGTAIDPSQVLTCFCATCSSGMADAGLDVDTVRQAIATWVGMIRQKDFHRAAEFGREDVTLAQWFEFRQRSVSLFVRRLADAASQIGPGLTLWIDLWPPAYSWFLGQDYSSLTTSSSTLKHFPYHRLGGGADVQALIESLASTDAERDDAFRAFQKFFDLPYGQRYEEFRDAGFPIRFVTDQNDQVRRLSAPATRIFSGVQMWNISPPNLLEAIAAAEDSAADEVLYYCYGWAADELFDAVRTLRDKETS